MREIRIDSPGAGDWIMERVGGHFRQGWDHSFSAHRDGILLGGFATVAYFGNAMTIHMAGRDKSWFSRDLAALAFGYVFHQLGCTKLLAPVRSDNFRSLSLCRRSGWQPDAVIRGVFPSADMVILSMTKETCPWLARRLPQQHQAREVA